MALQGSATVEIIDNSKDFADVSESAWFKPAVDFVSARGILSGVGEGAFGHDATMNRAMAMTMLARLEGVDTSGGETWYDKGMTWAAEAGISDGTAPMSDVTREQMAAMLWRYAGEPEANGGFEQFADAQAVSTWAEPAMRWAVEQGILNGDGTNLNASDSMTRAEVAQILMKFMENRMK